MSAGIDVLELSRDLGADELWRRSLQRSRERRALSAAGRRGHRSLLSAALVDLDAPALFRSARSSARDLSDAELWDFSAACARAKRLAANKGFLEQARAVSAPLVVAAVAGLAAPSGAAHTRAARAKSSQADARLLKLGTRGADVRKVQRALGIAADGVFGPKTRKAVKRFQRSKGLAADGVVGPKTRAALFAQSGGARLIRAWWVAPVQRALGIQADGVYGPQSRAAVRAYQEKHGLVVDGIVGPQTLAHLGISRGGDDDQGTATLASAPAEPEPAGGPASISQTLWDELALAKAHGLRLVSGHRAGATIAGGGGTSDHAVYPSRAIDVAGSPAAMRRYARAVAGRAGIRYVMYSPLGIWGSWTGTWRPLSGAALADHYSHVHVSATR